MNAPETIRNRLLTLISVLLVVAALKWSYPVTMPLVTAVFVVAAGWPIKVWLEHVLPPRFSYVGTVIALLLILGCFFAVIYVAIGQVIQIFAQDQEQFRALYETYVSWARERGLPTPGGDGGYDRLIAITQTVFWQVYSVLAYLGVIAVLVIMGLPEVPALADKFQHELDASENRELFATVKQIADKFRQYIGVTVLTSLITGVASSVWAFALGLDLALIWGILNFLLNFIPVIGNIIGIVPPTLYALVQFDGWTMALVVFIGFAVLQFTISNFVYPLLQGRGMSMPPVAIIVALLFWGWIWGVVGALLAVPLTAAFIIICEHFKNTEKIARILSRDE
ncbi:AI-2E family transporter [uncultured Jannaschia sp.]|uniref:AI-2E family transporter n=1 Tax=uncultured Jannaschia sp. TaxID=293347 RepID=UPI00263137CC|nr:AI-2E family transporter [uncultured Jannaschia sp.]